MAIAINVVAVRRRHWRHFLVLTSDKDFQLTTIQVSYNSIICNSVEHVEFCAWKRFPDSIDFLLPFEENCCRIECIECLSKLTVSMLLVNHSALSLKNSKVAILTWKITEKVWRQRIANIVGWGWRSNSTTTRGMWHEKPSYVCPNPWERFRRWENGFHMNWMKDSRKTEKPLAKCCSPGTKESHFSNCD